MRPSPETSDPPPYPQVGQLSSSPFQNDQHIAHTSIPFLLPPWSTGHHGIGQASLSVIKSTTIVIIKTSRLAISKLATLLASSSFSSLCSLIFYNHGNRIITITGHRFNTKSIRSSVTGFRLREFLEQLPATIFWILFP